MLTQPYLHPIWTTSLRKVDVDTGKVYPDGIGRQARHDKGTPDVTANGRTQNSGLGKSIIWTKFHRHLY